MRALFRRMQMGCCLGAFSRDSGKLWRRSGGGAGCLRVVCVGCSVSCVVYHVVCVVCVVCVFRE
jgi:hypothetical protein